MKNYSSESVPVSPLSPLLLLRPLKLETYPRPLSSLRLVMVISGLSIITILFVSFPIPPELFSTRLTKTTTTDEPGFLHGFGSRCSGVVFASESENSRLLRYARDIPGGIWRKLGGRFTNEASSEQPQASISHSQQKVRKVTLGDDLEEIPLSFPDEDTSDVNNETTIAGKTKEQEQGKGSGAWTSTGAGRMMDIEQIMDDMGVWNWQQDENLSTTRNNGDISNGPRNSNITTGDNNYQGKVTVHRSPVLSSVKIIPDEHHVSAFLNTGVVKRFLFFNDKSANPLSITITPCTSILLWNVKFWPVSENVAEIPDNLKTYRTQRTVTFTENSGRRGVYSIDIRALHRDSYVHLYATSFHSEPIRVYEAEPDSGFNYNFKSDQNPFHPRTKLFSDNSRDKFYQHIFTHVDSEVEASHGNVNSAYASHEESFDINKTKSGSFQINSNPVREERYETPSGGNKPRIWVRRLRANRLHVKWDASPINPHLMNYCIVVNTRRDYSSLCSASGERFGVLPPDLMHVTYYGSTSDGSVMMVEDDRNKNIGFYGSRAPGFSPAAERDSNLSIKHKIRHLRRASNHNKRSGSAYEGIVMGCVGKKTKYILNNLQPGKLYYFNVFLRDLSTNVSYPYVRTTLKYQSPKNAPNNLRDAKPTKFRLVDGTGKSIKEKALKFNLNKPCSELTIYVMPCGGGSVRYETLHGNRSVYSSGIVDSLDVIKIGMPQRGKYFVKIFQTSDDPLGQNHARMVEVFVGKKNKRFPLPKLPAITKLTEDESLRSCDTVGIQWWPSPDPRDNEYCIFLKKDDRKRGFQFKKPNQCDVERSLKSDPYVTHSLCLQRTLTPETMLLTQKIVGLQPGKTYVVQLILRRHNGKSLSYDLHHIKTTNACSEIEAFG